MSPVVVVDRLPMGLIATGGSGCAVSGGGRVVTCEVGGVEPAFTPALLRIPVSVAKGASGMAVDEIEASGGGALGVSRSTVPVVFSAKAAGVGIANFGGWFTNIDGTTDTQAGSHPYTAIVAMAFNESLNSGEEEPTAGEGPHGELLHGEPRGVDVKIPPGLVGNPQAVAQCSRELFDDSELGEKNGKGCPASSVVGVVQLAAKGIGQASDPVFNLVPPHGVAAEFGFTVEGGLNVFLNARVRSGGDYGITEEVKNAPQREPVYVGVTLWGVPAEKTHDFQRGGIDCVPDGLGGCGSSFPATPFLTLPTSCRGPQEVVAEERSTWQDEDMPPVRRSFLTHNNLGEPTGFTGCERLVHFEPSIAITPETTYADKPTGLSVDLRLPQGVNPEELATSGLRDTQVVLPEGVVINPGQAAGLAACQPSQELVARQRRTRKRSVRWAAVVPAGLESRDDGNHDAAATRQARRQRVRAAVKPAGPGAARRRLSGRREPEAHRRGESERTDRAVHDDVRRDPELPVHGLQAVVQRRRAGRAATRRCSAGRYTSTADFTPWSGRAGRAVSTSSFAISEAARRRGPCASPLPFAPSMIAGSTTDQAGGLHELLAAAARGRRAAAHLDAAVQDARGPAGDDLEGAAVRRTAGRAKGRAPRARRSGTRSSRRARARTRWSCPQPGQPPAPIYLTGPLRGRAVRPVDRGAADRRPVQPGHGSSRARRSKSTRTPRS